jgi:hypothetical protein
MTQQRKRDAAKGTVDAAVGDPYRTAKSSHEYLRAPRRTLDDMRRLSEEIKRARAGKKPTP